MIIVVVIVVVVMIAVEAGAGGVVDVGTVPIATPRPGKPAINAIQVQLGKLMPVEVRRDDILVQAARFPQPIRFDLFQQKRQKLGIPMILGGPKDPGPGSVEIPQTVK